MLEWILLAQIAFLMVILYFCIAGLIGVWKDAKLEMYREAAFPTLPTQEDK